MAWRIIPTKRFDREYGQILLRAYGEGKLHAVIEAMKQLRARLEKDPLAEGEPHNRLKHIGLILCDIFERPLHVKYGVDEARQWVYLRNITYLTP